MEEQALTLVVRLPLIDTPEMRNEIIPVLKQLIQDTVTKVVLNSIKIELPLANAGEIKGRASRLVNEMVTNEMPGLVVNLVKIDDEMLYSMSR